MASINDIGGALPDTLKTPPLGGPDGWAAAVRDALDSDDTTVNARLAAALAEYAPVDHTHPSLERGVWIYDTATTPSAPATGRVRTDAAAFVDTTEIYLSETTANGMDVSALLELVQAGDLLAFQQESDAANWGRARVTGPAVDNGTWRTIPVEYVDGGGTGVSKNQNVTIQVTLGTGGGGAGGGASALDDLTDVDTSTVAPTDGQALVWDDVSGQWAPGDVAAGGPSALEGSVLEFTAINDASFAASSSSFAFKGTRFVAREACRIVGVSFPVNNPQTSHSYRVKVVTEVGNTIDSVLGDTGPFNPDVNQTGMSYVPAPALDVSLAAGDKAVVLVGRTDQGPTFALPVPFGSGGNYSMQNVLTWDDASWTVPSDDPGPGQAMNTVTSTAAVPFVLWVEVGTFPFSPPSDLDGLTDVDTSTTAPTDGQALVWSESAGQWVPGDVAAGGGGGGASALDDLTDVDLTTTAPELGDHLEYDGSGWVPAAPSAVVTTQWVYFTLEGEPVAPLTGANSWYNDSGADAAISTVRVSAATAPSGGTLDVRVVVGGAEAVALSLPDGQATAQTSVITTPALAQGAAMTVDITGNSGAAADVTVQIGVLG